ncbi:GNAT family N-acetyltransferase [Oceanirhabdus seepicola]|uniref:GNAT family N-acetyltransferase n=1 Tax=Oceanirhabdus seepicola TaxID=2828781 RepID=A0A9J6P8L5_9CLOT|nr:GNAT family N-acetyltransferase [Oceanirhabdus seepicola]MCM1991885.1 GNAT family N-acetyltransferase [Oceanirhabdus seepicola]
MIRKYKDEDYIEVTKVHVDSWKTTYRGIVPDEYLENMTYESRYDRNRQFMASGNVSGLVFENKDKNLVGFAKYGSSREDICNKGGEKYDGELYGIYFLKEAQGQGYGKQLLNKVREELKERGFKNMILWALEENNACGFYKAMGGEKLSEEKWLEYGGKKVKAVAFGWKL